MKKTLFLILILVLCFIVIISCKKDNSPSALIVGKWFWVEQSTQIYSVRGVQTSNIDKTTFDPASYYEFDKDGTLIYNQENSNGILVYWKYQLYKDSVGINGKGYLIKKLTSSSLILHRSTGASDTDKQEEELTFKK